MKKYQFACAVSALLLAVAGCSTSPFSNDEYGTLKSTSSAQKVRSDKAVQYSGLATTPVTPTPQPTSEDYNQLLVPDQAPPLGTTNFTPVAPKELDSTGTLVGLKAQQLRNDLILLQNSIAEQNQTLQSIRNSITKNTQFYHSVVASISTRLQVGTTPGNPVLIDQWNKAQGQLNNIAQNVSDMNNLSNSVAGSATLSGYLLDAVSAAYTLSGAVEEDHRQLGILENDIKRTMVLIDRLLGELSRDVTRQSAYLNNEKRNLTALSLAIKNGEMYGRSLSSSSTSQPVNRRMAAPVSPVVSRAPLVVIAFSDTHVKYEKPLYDAVSQVLAKKPDAGFEIVSVTPGGKSALDVSRNMYRAQKNTQDVMNSLVELGLSSDKIMVSEVQDTSVRTDEVRVYIR